MSSTLQLQMTVPSTLELGNQLTGHAARVVSIWEVWKQVQRQAMACPRPETNGDQNLVPEVAHPELSQDTMPPLGKKRASELARHSGFTKERISKLRLSLCSSKKKKKIPRKGPGHILPSLVSQGPI